MKWQRWDSAPLGTCCLRAYDARAPEPLDHHWGWGLGVFQHLDTGHIAHHGGTHPPDSVRYPFYEGPPFGCVPACQAGASSGEGRQGPGGCSTEPRNSSSPQQGSRDGGAHGTLEQRVLLKLLPGSEVYVGCMSHPGSTHTESTHSNSPILHVRVKVLLRRSMRVISNTSLAGCATISQQGPSLLERSPDPHTGCISGSSLLLRAGLHGRVPDGMGRDLPWADGEQPHQPPGTGDCVTGPDALQTPDMGPGCADQVRKPGYTLTSTVRGMWVHQHSITHLRGCGDGHCHGFALCWGATSQAIWTWV